MTTKRIRPGIEILVNDKFASLSGQRIGLVCNQASVFPDLRHVADIFSGHPDLDLTTLFGPQHGIRGDVQDNMIETDHTIDPRTGIPIYSLYSETREPTEKMLENVDTIVFDLQDVGCRIYTFVYTMANCMRAAKKYGKRVVVCDRPNPIGGLAVEGNITEHEFKSFVGQFEIPTRHGMTTGELALMFNDHFGIGCELEVVKMDGWTRDMWGVTAGYGLDAGALDVRVEPGSFSRGGEVRASVRYVVSLQDLPFLSRVNIPVAGSHRERIDPYRSRWQSERDR